MAFLLRVQVDSPSAEVTSALIESLGVMAGLQGPHTGMVTYHFSRPDPETSPNHFEFTEVYANEATFWSHVSNPEFAAAYYKAFGPNKKLETTMYAYGAGLQGKIKETCDTIFKARYPQSVSGFFLKTSQWDLTSSYSEDTDDGPILVITQIQSKQGKAKEILKQISNLSEASNKGVVMCYASIPEEEKEPDTIEFVELCTTNSHLTAHMSCDTENEMLKALLQNAESLTCRGYGMVLPQTAQSLQDFGLPLVARKTDAGFVLHAQADPTGT